MIGNDTILDKLEEVGSPLRGKKWARRLPTRTTGVIMEARREYTDCLQTLREAKETVAAEEDPEMKELACEEMAEAERRIPEIEERIKLLLVPAAPGGRKERHHGDTW